MADFKNFLYTWCSKNYKTLKYSYNTFISNYRSQFTCSANISTFDYVGTGTSTSKKDAQTCAAKDFINFLIKEGAIPANALSLNAADNESNTSINNTHYNHLMGEGENMTNMSSIEPDNVPHIEPSENNSDELLRQQKLEETKNLDKNADIHGNWTLEYAKSRLHQYLQTNKIHTEYVYTCVGTPHNRSFIAEMKICLKEQDTNISAKEHGITKIIASKACALVLVRQLFHMGIIESFQGPPKKEQWNMEPFVVNLQPTIIGKLDNTLNLLHIPPEPIAIGKEIYNVYNYSDLLPEENETDFVDKTIAWSLPASNWNPWTSLDIDDQLQTSCELLSLDINKKWEAKLEQYPIMRKILDERDLLPIFELKGQILNLIQNNSVIIIKGPTGCGKTTQVPQYILDDYMEKEKGGECSILVTEPRRMNCLLAAERVCEERLESLSGDTSAVGYTTPFITKYPRPFGSILFCTTEYLVKKLEKGLKGVSHIIIDEIHERDLYTDFLLLVLKGMISIYPNIKIILMSGSRDTEKFSKYFDDCPVIEVFVRSYPVQRYFLEDCVQMTNFDFDGSVSSAIAKIAMKRKQKLENTDIKLNGEGDEIDNVDENNDDTRTKIDETMKYDENFMNINLNACVSKAYKPETRHACSKLMENDISFELIHALLEYIDSLQNPGATLIIFPGITYITSFNKYLINIPKYNNPQTCRIFQFHSYITHEEQRKVYQLTPVGINKIILATNIAETSATINDVIYVVDTCKVDTRIYAPANDSIYYITRFASKYNLEQRMDSAGRVKPGFCFHLCSRARYETLDDTLAPEIFSAPLHEICLIIKHLKLGNIAAFLSKAIDPPLIEYVNASQASLIAMGALQLLKNESKDNIKLTSLGNILVTLPFEPKVGKMVIFATILGLGDSLSVIAAFMYYQRFFDIEIKKSKLTFQETHGRLSDQVSQLITFQRWEKAKNIDEITEINYCKENNIPIAYLKLINETKNIIKKHINSIGFDLEILKSSNIDTNSDNKLDMILALLCIGCNTNFGYHIRKRKVMIVGGNEALISRKSILCSNNIFHSPFMVFGEMTSTKRSALIDKISEISLIDILVFGTFKLKILDNNIVLIDNWIKLKVDPYILSKFTSLRSVAEKLLETLCFNPSFLNEIRVCQSKPGFNKLNNKKDDTATKAVLLINGLYKICEIDSIKAHEKMDMDDQNIMGELNRLNNYVLLEEEAGDEDGDKLSVLSYNSGDSYHASHAKLIRFKHAALVDHSTNYNPKLKDCTFIPTNLGSLLQSIDKKDEIPEASSYDINTYTDDHVDLVKYDKGRPPSFFSPRPLFSRFRGPPPPFMHRPPGHFRHLAPFRHFGGPRPYRPPMMWDNKSNKRYFLSDVNKRKKKRKTTTPITANKVNATSGSATVDSAPAPPPPFIDTSNITSENIKGVRIDQLDDKTRDIVLRARKRAKRERYMKNKKDQEGNAVASKFTNKRRSFNQNKKFNLAPFPKTGANKSSITPSLNSSLNSNPPTTPSSNTFAYKPTSNLKFNKFKKPLSASFTKATGPPANSFKFTEYSNLSNPQTVQQAGSQMNYNDPSVAAMFNMFNAGYPSMPNQPPFNSFMPNQYGFYPNFPFQ
ncbi:unnamed protein product [Gordionus sp. m RMFG-2023]|uniref:ATP-dependent RNA helicase A-like isoform X2 n=1 Tax=Gordionus sp. m RMFG-2023 TaxID=3053472 RepID=UPI0030E3596F